jgi:D-erythronate 2-dehydrogenase
LNILITGADGFIGRALVARLLSEEDLPGVGSSQRRLILVDQQFGAASMGASGTGAGSTGGYRVRYVAGDITDRDVLRDAMRERVDCVFHLASVPGGRSESDFELGLRGNLEGTVSLFESLRGQGAPPKVVFASTIGVYGVPLPDVIDEQTAASPSMSYGAHKLIGEILVSDYSRRGFIDGRSLRLPGIVARPPQPTGMLSAFLSDIIRNLSSGREFVCPVAPEGMAWWMSRAQVVDNLLHAAGMSVERNSARRVWLLPVLHASLGDVVSAIAHVHGPDVLRKVTYHPNAALQAQFANLPPLRCPESMAVGFQHDGTLETLVQRALEGP